MIFSSNDVLTPTQLKRLSEHKYNSYGYTLLDPFLQPYWNWLVTKLPLWLAPNLMTILGLTITIVTTLILVYYSPDAKQEPPSWAFLLCAAGLFTYQSLDAIDGKQARRTESSTPLGELFDHGCDSISTVFVSLGICIAVRLGTFTNWMFFQCFIAITLFYCAHWQTYITGSLRFNKFDVTECQCSITVVHILSALFGTNLWTYQLPYLNIELRLIPILLALCVSLVLCYYHMVVVCHGGVGRNGSTVAGTSVLSPSIPIGLVIILSITIYQKSTEHVYENHPCLYILAFGIVAAKVTNKLVVAHMTRSELDYFDSVLIGPGMLFLNQYFNTYFNEHVILWLCLVYSVADLIHYSTIGERDSYCMENHRFLHHRTRTKMRANGSLVCKCIEVIKGIIRIILYIPAPNYHVHLAPWWLCPLSLDMPCFVFTIPSNLGWCVIIVGYCRSANMVPLQRRLTNTHLYLSNIE